MSSQAPETTAAPTLAKLDSFARRHLGVHGAGAEEMAQFVGHENLDSLVDNAVPANIRLANFSGLPEPLGEDDMLKELKALSRRNQVFRTYIGLGYTGTITPPVIQRNILENPGWYTQYTPYQAEISQGRMEALLNFQTMVADLTGMDIANASLLDEGTAAAEAVTLCYGHSRKRDARQVLLSANCLPQTIEVVQTRCAPLGLEAKVVDFSQSQDLSNAFAIVVQYPDTDGVARDYSALASQAKGAEAMVIACCDPLALAILKPPGEWGADVAIGSAQRFGVPMGFGGPHAAFFATKDAYKRKMPGRLIGVSKDATGLPALRLSLQTREQHIRRDKATSNICTAQVLLANIASTYAVYHGPQGIRAIASRVRLMTLVAKKALSYVGLETPAGERFDTIVVAVPDAAKVHARAEAARINLRRVDSKTVGFTLDETVSPDDLADLLELFSDNVAFTPESLESISAEIDAAIEPALRRESPILAHPIFNRYHSETELLRYLKRLENKDLSLTTSMIPLGSCTMKLNASAEMLPITWPEFGAIHPFAPTSQTAGYAQLIKNLEDWLGAVTGFAGVSLQPNAGSQGEYAGLLVIRQFHLSRGDAERNVCLIPLSAHGTNPATAIMAGMKVVPVACDDQGNIDLNDLRIKAEANTHALAAIMLTYPSTHGVFEIAVREVCEIVHRHGGQVYMDGANMNAQCGLTSPGEIGADVCHLNLHKTFCIPHGGGGPGIGPIGVAEHLVSFLPKHCLAPHVGGEQGVGAVSAAPYGSASILPISWAYVRMMGGEGITQATKIAILNANYMAKRLESHFPIVYRGANGLVAHEFIIDFRTWKEQAGIEVEDVAKRLMDYGFHAPTMSWPVPGTMMIEPTESESRAELDRLCDALISIKEEMLRIASGEWPLENNPLVNAPHTSALMATETWTAPYTRERAAFPAPWSRDYKYWPAVSRVDNVYGDRNLVCSCLPMDAY